MDAWAALDAFLLIEHNINYWEDDAVDHALELLEALDDAGRDALEAARVDRQPTWRRQLATPLCGDQSAPRRALDAIRPGYRGRSRGRREPRGA